MFFYILMNKNGVILKVIDFGVWIVVFDVFFIKNEFWLFVLGFFLVDEYLFKDLYFGVIIGWIVGWIVDGFFELVGKMY